MAQSERTVAPSPVQFAVDHCNGPVHVPVPRGRQKLLHSLPNARFLHIMSSVFCRQEGSLSQIAALDVCVSSSLAPDFDLLCKPIDVLVEVFLRVESEGLLRLENLQQRRSATCWLLRRTF